MYRVFSAEKRTRTPRRQEKRPNEKDSKRNPEVESCFIFRFRIVTPYLFFLFFWQVVSTRVPSLPNWRADIITRDDDWNIIIIVVSRFGMHNATRRYFFFFLF